MYEARGARPLSFERFAWRFARHFGVAAALILLSLALGMAGYRAFEHMAWADAFVNSAMLLGGMGPVDPLKTDAGKIFAGVYALYAGLVFLIVAGLLLAPVVHRILHRFHWEEEKGGKSP